jgi:hypothetical protein
MTSKRAPLAAGVAGAFRHWRLAGVVWLSLLLPLLIVWPSLRVATASFDEGPFGQTILKGWDSWAVCSWLIFRGREIQAIAASVTAAIAASVLLQLFLVGGLLRTLIVDVRRPVLRRVVSESASLFRANLGAFGRYLLRLAFWIALVVAIPATLLTKIAGKEAPPNNPLATAATWWVLLSGLAVYLVVSIRFDLARVILARGDTPTARGASRVAKMRLSGKRLSALSVLLVWLVAGIVIQVAFTSIGLRMNPGTDAGILGLVVFRQFGFFLLAMARIGFWASLLSWEDGRRPVLAPFVARVPVSEARLPVPPPPTVEIAVPEPAALEPGLEEPLPETVA